MAAIAAYVGVFLGDRSKWQRGRLFGAALVLAENATGTPHFSGNATFTD
jgi:hypothetical protein